MVNQVRPGKMHSGHCKFSHGRVEVGGTCSTINPPLWCKNHGLKPRYQPNHTRPPYFFEASMKPDPARFQASHALLQSCIDQHLLSGVSAVVLKDGVEVDRICLGQANLETGEALREDHIHRAFSNTKLLTSTLVLMLHDQGHFALDDPIKNWIPSLGKLKVLRPGATALTDTFGIFRQLERIKCSHSPRGGSNGGA